MRSDRVPNTKVEMVVTRALTMTNGVASESAGGVSVSYTQNWSSGGGAGALQSTDVETLEPYKLRGVF